MEIVIAVVALLLNILMVRRFIAALDVQKRVDFIAAPSNAKPAPPATATFEVKSNKVANDYSAGLIGIFLVTALMWWLSPLAMMAKVGMVVAGVLIGFVAGLLRHHEWEAVMERLANERLQQEARAPRSRKIILREFLLVLASLSLLSWVRSNFGREMMEWAYGILLFGGVHIGTGYMLEHLTLYGIYRSNRQISKPEDSL